MDYIRFTDEDFNIFTIEGFQERMDALINTVRPKLHVLGDYFAQQLSIMTGEEIFPHVAKNPLVLCNTTNAPMFALCFAAANRKYGATGVKIAQDVLKA